MKANINLIIADIRPQLLKSGRKLKFEHFRKPRRLAFAFTLTLVEDLNQAQTRLSSRGYGVPYLLTLGPFKLNIPLVFKHNKSATNKIMHG